MEYPAKSFDLVISRLAIHFIEDVKTVFTQVFKALNDGGRFIFSIEHPVITSTLQPTGTRKDWIVDNYFNESYREQQWLGGQVFKYHRTIENYFMSIQNAGFIIEGLRESVRWL